MITTRSLLPDWFTAAWIELKRQRAKSLSFRRSSLRPSRSVIFWRGCVGRDTYPTVSASLIDSASRSSESGWQTTRVTLRRRLGRADFEASGGDARQDQGTDERGDGGEAQLVGIAGGARRERSPSSPSQRGKPLAAEPPD